MSIIVQKFGGTSVSDVEKIQNIVSKIKNEKLLGNKVIVVVSAMAGVTNQLANYCISMCNLDNKAQLEEYDVALSSGEIITSALLALALQNNGLKAHSLLSWQIPIKTNDHFSKALIKEIDTKLLNEYLSQDIIPVIAGFQGVNNDFRITTLGRGGSDTTAVAIAASVGALRCDIYTDVDGVFSSDPRLVKNAKKIKEISYEEMLEFSSMGAKVLHTRSVQIAMKYNIPLKVISTFSNDIENGTIIINKNKIMEQRLITGITHNKAIASITINNPDDNLLQRFSDNKITIEFIQNHNNQAFIIIPLGDISSAKVSLQNLNYEIKTDIALISIIGFGIRNDNNIINLIISNLKKNDIDVMMIFTSEIKITIMIKEEDTESIVKIMHDILL